MYQYKKLLRPRLRHLAARWILTLALFAIAALMGGGAYRQQMATAANAEQYAYKRAESARRMAPLNKPMDAKELTQWRELQAERSFPWDLVFQAIENASTADVELLDFVPDKMHRRIVLRGEAKDNAALIDYLNALTAQTQLQGIYLAHRQIIERDKLVTVEFEIRGAVK